MARPLFIGSEIYRGSTYGRGHPLDIPRVSGCMDLCRALDWLDEENYCDSPQATADQLSAYHDAAYLDALARAEAGPLDAAEAERYSLGVNGNSVFPEVFRRPATACGAGLLAAELLTRGSRDIVFSPGGGQHHGRPDRAAGFCFLNEPALSIQALLDGGAGRVFYLDLDAHHGDGVQDAFLNDERVYTLSIHETGRWPMARKPADFAPGSRDDRSPSHRNLDVPPDFNDDELAFLMDAAVLPALADFCPGAVYVQCGVDALADDPQSKLALSNTALWTAVTAVAALAPKLLVTGGGGYNPWSVARAWSGVWSALNGIGDPGPLPAAAEAVLREFHWNHRRGRTPPEHWFTTLADHPNSGPVRDDVRNLI